MFAALSVLYSLLIVAWLALYALSGDALWWMALLNSFVPYFFAPLAVFLPASLLCRRWPFLMLVFPLLICLGLYVPVFLPAPPAASAADGTSLTVMSFNLWAGSKTSETAHVIFDQGTPDVIALQELGYRMERILLEEAGDVYPYYTASLSLGYRGMGVLSRYPMTELDASHLQDPGWQIQVVRIETESGPVVLYNVHPISTNVLIYLERGLDVPERVRASFASRYRLVRRLLDDVATRSEPVIVAGDFNSTERSDVYRLLSDHLTDAHRAVGWGFGHTFPAYTGRYRGVPVPAAQMRIDMIFSSAELRPVSCVVGSTWGESDHRPVLAEFVWRR